MDGREVIVTGMLTVTLACSAASASSDAQAARAPEARDACSLVTSDEIAAAAATTVRSSRPGSVPGGSECRYQTRAGYALTITMSDVDPKDFDELRGLFAGDATAVAGIGDAAYFLENHRIYVRAGRRQLVVSRGDSGDAKSRDVLLAIARLAVPRL